MNNTYKIKTKGSTNQEFKISLKIKTVLQILSAFLVIMLFLILVRTISGGEFGLMNFIFLTGYFFLLYYLQMHFIRIKNQDITIDDEGLWYTKLGKDESFVGWNEIAGISMRLPKGLVLFNSAGKVRIILRLELIHFALLKLIVERKTDLVSSKLKMGW